MTDTAPAGWYPDPLRAAQQRYWDGHRWTDHVHGPPPPPQPTTFSPTPTPVGPATMSDREARNWAVAAHLSALAGLVIGLSFIGPLIVYLAKKDEHPLVRRHAIEALNFNLSVLIYAIVLGAMFLILVFVLIGWGLIPIFLLGGVAWLVLTIVAAVRAGSGQEFRYPMTIRFVD